MATSGTFWTDRTTDGTSGTVAFDGGTLTLFVQGTLDGAAVKLEFNEIGTHWDLLDQVIYSTGADNFTIAATNLRCTLEGGGANMDIDVTFDTV